jgi:hypothetical protein
MKVPGHRCLSCIRRPVSTVSDGVSDGGDDDSDGKGDSYGSDYSCIRRPMFLRLVMVKEVCYDSTSGDDRVDCDRN